MVSGAVLAVLALVLTAFALRYPGERTSDVEVSNGGVWVTDRSEGLIGRMNVDAQELDARLAVVGDEVDILQSGYYVLAISARGYSLVNTASVVRGGVVELPPRSEVALGGDRVAITAADGRVWILTPEQAAVFDPRLVDPVYTASGSDLQVVVTTSGTVLVLDGDLMLTFPRAVDTATPVQEDPAPVPGLSSKDGSVQLTAVGEQPVVLDRENRLLHLGVDGRRIDLANAGISDPAQTVLQQPGEVAEHVVLASIDALVQVPMDGGEPIIHPAGGTGDPAAPAQVGGCAYGAWNGSLRYVRVCGDAQPVVDDIPGSSGAGDLVLRVNRDLVVLNDRVEGMSWMIGTDMTLIDDWVITQEIQQEQKEEKEEVVTTTMSDVQEERDRENRPPVANDDEVGVRAGAKVVLPVTRNDTDPDGDVLLAAVQGEQPGIGTVTAIRGGTQLQIAVDEDAGPTATFDYRVEDGRGGTDVASVTLTVLPASENSAPVPAENAITAVQVLSGETVTLNVLPYWEDPEGDMFSLADASIAPEDLVSFRPDGTVTIDDAGLVTGMKQVTLVLRDEHGASSEHILEVEAVTDPELPPITTTDHLQVIAGRSATIAPLANDINPAGGELSLMHVDEVEGLDIEADLVTGSVSVGGEVGTYYAQYTVGSVSATSRGLIRVDVVPPDPDAMRPVAVDDMGLVTTGGDTLLDPLENDTDPGGGVLVLGSVQVPEGSGLKATVVGHHLVRVEASPGAEIAEEPVPLSYEVANATGAATGTIRVMMARTETQFANPIGTPDEAVVRAGDMVLVDVLDNDMSPTGSDLHLGEITDLAGVEDLGEVELHDQQLRFSASPDATGSATLTYEVVDETGRSGAARLSIEIIPADGANEPPRPENLVARAVAGTPVRIPVGTSGIDPDGDSVMLTGISEPAPALGEVTRVTGRWIEYLPFEDAVGTDRFRYQVMDRFGAVGTAEVLVGVAAPSDRNLPPYAVDDAIEVRPDREVQVPVLANDSDPEGEQLSVLHDEVLPSEGIEVVAPSEDETPGQVTVRTPPEAGTHSVQYGITDGQLGSAAVITVTVDPDAPLRAPVAIDDFVDPGDVLEADGTGIRLDLLANDRDPDGSVDALEIALEQPGTGMSLTDDGVLTVLPSEEQQRLRYTITDIDGLSSTGYVWVPGTARIAPTWMGGTLEVVAGSELSIDLGDPELVRVRPGASNARILDPSTVIAQHTDGTELVQDATTLLYRAAEGYEGRDTITLQVSDGAAEDDTAATGALVIPVRVLPGRTDLAPTLRGAVLEVERGGAAATLDLSASAEDPEGEELEFSLPGTELPEGIEVSVSGSVLSVTASMETARGESVQLPVAVTDGVTDPVTAQFQLLVVGSTRPLPSAVLDTADIDAGTTGSVPVLDNDANPFPEDPLTLVSVKLISGDGAIEKDGGEVVITPDADFAGVLSAAYTVEDATGAPQRRVTGEIRVTVRGTPAAPSAPRIGEVGDGTVELLFTAGADNGAPITGYTVTSTTGPPVSQECASTSCTITGLANGTEYAFQVTAHNEVGDSPLSAVSAPATPDVRPERPAAPTVEQGDGQLTVAWTAPENRGSSLQRFEIQRQATRSGQTQDRTVEASTTELVWEPLENGVDQHFRVRAHNLSEEPSEWSDWSRVERPAGPPLQIQGRITAERVNDPLGGGVKVSWPAAGAEIANGEPVTSYRVRGSDGSSVRVEAGTTSHVFRGLDRDSGFSATVTAVNAVAEGAESESSNEVVPFAVPEAPDAVTAVLPDPATGDGPDGRAVVSWKAPEDGGTPIEDYVIRWSTGSTTVPAGTTSTTVSGLDNGTSYRFTVQARNRFQGGESAISEPSASVTPYGRPAPPKVGFSDGVAGFCGKDDSGCTWHFMVDGSDSGDGSTIVDVDVEISADLECSHTEGVIENWSCFVPRDAELAMTAVAIDENGLRGEPTE